MSKKLTLSIAILFLLGLQIGFSHYPGLPPVHASTSPTVDHASVQEQVTSISITSGSQLYMFGFGTGGCCTSSSLQNGQYASVTNVAGFVVASLAITANNANSFTTSTAYQVMGGVGVSGYSSYSASYGRNSSSGAVSASDTFTINTTGNMILVFGIGGGEQCLTLSGIPALQIDASSPNDHSALAMTIGHSYLSPGTYTASEQTQQCAAGQTANNAGDIIGVIVFTPSTSNPNPPANASWVQLSPNLSPSARTFHSMAYDAADSYVVLFGGQATNQSTLSDTWKFQGGSWTKLSPSTPPSARMEAAMTYDAADGYLLLFGGMSDPVNAGCTSVLGDTWKFAGGIWTQLSPGTSPSPRMAMRMVYDAADGYVLLFGGTNNPCSVGGGLADTWKYKAGIWTQLSPGTSPTARYDYGVTYDTLDGYVLFFGGWNPNDGCGNVVADTWKFTAGNWTQLSPSNSPNARQEMGLSFDSSLNYPLLFSGWSGTCGIPRTYYQDTWEFKNSNWLQLSPPSSPTARGGHGMTFDVTDNYTLVEGGYDGTSNDFDTWKYSVGSATNLATQLHLDLSATTVELGSSFPVHISGTLANGSGSPISMAIISISYQLADGSSVPLTAPQTDSNGFFQADWFPQATGTFKVIASYAGDTHHLASTDSANLVVTLSNNHYVFSVVSNVTVTNLVVDTSAGVLNFTLSGPSGLRGAVSIFVAKSLVPNVNSLRLRLNGTLTSFSYVASGDSYTLYFTTHLSKYLVGLGGLIFGVPVASGIQPYLGLVAFAVLSVLFLEQKCKSRKTEQ